MMFQSYALFPHMTVESNVGYGLRRLALDAATRRARVAEALDMVQLGHLGDVVANLQAQPRAGDSGCLAHRNRLDDVGRHLPQSRAGVGATPHAGAGRAAAVLCAGAAASDPAGGFLRTRALLISLTRATT